MAEFAGVPGRVVVQFGVHTYECHECKRSIRSVFDRVPLVPACSSAEEARDAFADHVLAEHPHLAPSPDGCRYCGWPRRTHGHSYAPGVGSHYWVDPTGEQRLVRMRTRRAARSAA
ncbi:hypothetical protein [Curtobacterium sp. MCBD17_040]|uniref:hypothetical protein n=1 Tax=Curtobacterium sp. MCBD17_040 TaxID=2175674 RepID=UPI000DA9EC8C|nr:hypothetical protein [Curtobacterium sp. MCBD17_040]WIB65273.1 hypothetical protein DEI94_17870 [Curtobacterium sp. MCBD17_040]